MPERTFTEADVLSMLARTVHRSDSVTSHDGVVFAGVVDGKPLVLVVSHEQMASADLDPRPVAAARESIARSMLRELANPAAREREAIEEKIEAAYWEFDGDRKRGTRTERDAFKGLMRRALRDAGANI